MTDQREKLNTVSVDLDRELIHRYQAVAKARRQRGARALIEEVLAAQIDRLEAKAEKRKGRKP